MAGYKDLIVWQKAMDLVEDIYLITRNFPNEERYALADQMRRAAVSIPSNIAEGQSRNSQKEFKNFLSIAKGSKSELETQLIISKRLRYITQEDLEKHLDRCSEIGRMISSLSDSLS